MEINRKLLSCNRKTRAFRANFERMLAIVQFNKILLLTTGEFRVIDVNLIPIIIILDSWRTYQKDKVH